MPFYELRTRLYGCAAAGCSAVNEDFRLKRAVDDFAPLAEANKAFGKLYNMCGRLFSEDNTALLLADCIALADALAVAQGGFADNSETAEGTFSADVPHKENAPYSAVKALEDKIEKAGQTLETLSSDEKLLIGDPRILAAFIGKAGVNSTYFTGFAEMMCSAYGKAVVIPLKNSVDMSDEKASGNQVTYVAETAGYDENDWYLTLAHNENAPQGVRLRAIEALGRDVRNGQELLDIYNTEKGKVKNAALLETARLNIPEAEGILAKMKEKYKQAYRQYFAVSSSAAAVELAHEMAEKACGDADDRPKIEDVISLMYNKPDSDDCFIKLSEYISHHNNGYYTRNNERSLNNVLISNLANEPNDEYKALISRLYAADERSFFTAHFFMRFTEDPLRAFDDIAADTKEKKYSALDILKHVVYFDQEKMYYISYTPNYDRNGSRLRLPLFDIMPQNIIDFIGSKPENAGGGLITKLVKTVKKTIGANDDVDPEYQLSTFLQILPNCSPEDLERIRKAAVELALFSAENDPSYRTIDVICKYHRDGKPEDYLGITEKFVMRNYREGHITYPDFIDEFPLSREQKIGELEHLKRSLAAALTYNGVRDTLYSIIDNRIAKLKH